MSENSASLPPPVRAEHIGSLLRPAALYQKLQLLEQTHGPRHDLKEVEDQAIKHVLNLQYEVGMKALTDGELRRSMFFEGVFEKLEGMTIIPNRPIFTFKRYIPHIKLMYNAKLEYAETIFCTGKIRRTTSWYVEDFKYLKRLVPAEDVKLIKVTMCSPTWFHQRHGSDMTYDITIYKTDDEYFDDIGSAYRAEIKELYDNGCRYIQIDDPTFCYFCDDEMIAEMEEEGVDHQSLLETYIRAINICLQDRPGDMRVGLHMCRGNFKNGVYFATGSYHRIASKVFKELNVDTFYLEYDTDRAGDFEPLKYLPIDKVAVLGLVTTKNGKLEEVGALCRRVEEAASVLIKGNPPRSREMALNQLCVSPQCGFASVWEGSGMTEAEERAKLSLVVAVAHAVWGDRM